MTRTCACSNFISILTNARQKKGSDEPPKGIDIGYTTAEGGTFESIAVTTLLPCRIAPDEESSLQSRLVAEMARSMLTYNITFILRRAEFAPMAGVTWQL